MKKVILLLALFITIGSYGQNIVAGSGDTIASINSSGIIKDVMNQQIGEITASGQVQNSQGQLVGSIVGDKFNDASGVLIAERKVLGGVIQLVFSGDFVFATVESGNQIVEHTGDMAMKSEGTVSETQLIAYFLYYKLIN